jgi:RNA polymerase sigma factor for flagellar operon FliA
MVPSTQPFYSCTFPQHERPQSDVPTDENSGTQGMVLKYLPLVRMIAWQIYGSLPLHAAVEMGDVVQAGHVGLVDASRSYHPGADVPFASYARHRIRGEILDSLRKLDAASRGLRRWQRKLDSETRNLTLALSREPSEEEVSTQLGMNVEHLRKRRLSLWYTSSCIQHSSRPGEPGDGALIPIAALEGNPDRLHQRSQMRMFLSRAVSVLPPRSRKVVILYYLRNLTMKQIGTQLNVNESRISQIHKHALETMARGLAAAGVKSFQDI